MRYNLFLDDVRSPAQAMRYMEGFAHIYRDNEWEIARNYDEFVKLIDEHGLPQIVSFDHDLAEIHYDPRTWKEGFKYDEKTGYDCAKYLVEYCLQGNYKLPEWYVHSMNPVGKQNIAQLLENYEKHESNIS